MRVGMVGKWKEGRKEGSQSVSLENTVFKSTKVANRENKNSDRTLLRWDYRTCGYCKSAKYLFITAEIQ